MEPDLRYFFLCDEVRADPEHPQRIDVQGLITSIASRTDPPFPVVHPLFHVLVVLANFSGEGELSLRIVGADLETEVFRNRPRLIRVLSEARELVGIVFQLRNCRFPTAGVYWVECIFSDRVIGRQPIDLTILG